MEPVATTKLSSKGQVVIPEEVRKQLGLKTGDQFVVLGKGDAVVLKSIKKPSMRDFDQLIKEARRQARAVGLKRSDISRSISRVRAGK